MLHEYYTGLLEIPGKNNHETKKFNLFPFTIFYDELYDYLIC
jgi:hypothetical protein